MTADEPVGVEQCFATLERLRTADGERRFAVSLVGERMLAALAPSGELEIFVVCSTGELDQIDEPRVGAHGTFFDATRGDSFQAAVLRVRRTPDTLRLTAHAAYDAARAVRLAPHADVRAVLTAIRPFLRLFEDAAILRLEAQVGLFGEIALLRRLLAEALEVWGSAGIDRALGAWLSPGRGMRDFGAAGWGVEVKTTTRDERVHHISRMDQLLPWTERRDDRLFIWSLGLRPDVGAPKRLLDLYFETESLAGSRANELRRLVTARGLDLSLAERYREQPGLSVVLEPRLYEVVAAAPILRMNSFVGGALPDGCSRVAYDLDLTGWSPLNAGAEGDCLRAMLAAVDVGAA